jgi:hypothetical protein
VGAFLARRRAANRLGCGFNRVSTGGTDRDAANGTLFRTIWEVDQTWIPEIRRLVALEEQRGKRVFQLGSVADLDGFKGRS